MKLSQDDLHKVIAGLQKQCSLNIPLLSSQEVDSCIEKYSKSRCQRKIYQRLYFDDSGVDEDNESECDLTTYSISCNNSSFDSTTLMLSESPVSINKNDCNVPACFKKCFQSISKDEKVINVTYADEQDIGINNMKTLLNYTANDVVDNKTDKQQDTSRQSCVLSSDDLNNTSVANETNSSSVLNQQNIVKHDNQSRFVKNVNEIEESNNLKRNQEKYDNENGNYKKIMKTEHQVNSLTATSHTYLANDVFNDIQIDPEISKVLSKKLHISIVSKNATKNEKTDLNQAMDVSMQLNNVEYTDFSITEKNSIGRDVQDKNNTITTNNKLECGDKNHDEEQNTCKITNVEIQSLQQCNDDSVVNNNANVCHKYSNDITDINKKDVNIININHENKECNALIDFKEVNQSKDNMKNVEFNGEASMQSKINLIDKNKTMPIDSSNSLTSLMSQKIINLFDDKDAGIDELHVSSKQNSVSIRAVNKNNVTPLKYKPIDEHNNIIMKSPDLNNLNYINVEHQSKIKENKKEANKNKNAVGKIWVKSLAELIDKNLDKSDENEIEHDIIYPTASISSQIPYTKCLQTISTAADDGSKIFGSSITSTGLVTKPVAGFQDETSSESSTKIPKLMLAKEQPVMFKGSLYSIEEINVLFEKYIKSKNQENIKKIVSILSGIIDLDHSKQNGQTALNYELEYYRESLANCFESVIESFEEKFFYVLVCLLLLHILMLLINVYCKIEKNNNNAYNSLITLLKKNLYKKMYKNNQKFESVLMSKLLRKDCFDLIQALKLNLPNSNVQDINKLKKPLVTEYAFSSKAADKNNLISHKLALVDNQKMTSIIPSSVATINHTSMEASVKIPMTGPPNAVINYILTPDDTNTLKKGIISSCNKFEQNKNKNISTITPFSKSTISQIDANIKTVSTTTIPKKSVSDHIPTITDMKTFKDSITSPSNKLELVGNNNIPIAIPSSLPAVSQSSTQGNVKTSMTALSKSVTYVPTSNNVNIFKDGITSSCNKLESNNNKNVAIITPSSKLKTNQTLIGFNDIFTPTVNKLQTGENRGVFESHIPKPILHFDSFTSEQQMASVEPVLESRIFTANSKTSDLSQLIHNSVNSITNNGVLNELHLVKSAQNNLFNVNPVITCAADYRLDHQNNNQVNQVEYVPNNFYVAHNDTDSNIPTTENCSKAEHNNLPLTNNFNKSNVKNNESNMLYNNNNTHYLSNYGTTQHLSNTEVHNINKHQLSYLNDTFCNMSDNELNSPNFVPHYQDSLSSHNIQDNSMLKQYSNINQVNNNHNHNVNDTLEQTNIHNVHLHNLQNLQVIEMDNNVNKSNSHAYKSVSTPNLNNENFNQDQLSLPQHHAEHSLYRYVYNVQTPVATSGMVTVPTNNISPDNDVSVVYTKTINHPVQTIIPPNSMATVTKNNAVLTDNSISPLNTEWINQFPSIPRDIPGQGLVFEIL